MYSVAILGGSGYTGGELLRLLYYHPEINIEYVTSREYKGKPVHYAHPHLRGFYKNLRFKDINIDKISEMDIVFSALPHGIGLEYTYKLAQTGNRIIDLSADYRLRNPDDYMKWYGFKHPYPELLNKFIYGLPEIKKSKIINSKLIASPGCNATVAILGLYPLIKNDLIADKIVIDVKVGSSEAGRKPHLGSHHPERHATIRPYSPKGHRHTAEVIQELNEETGKNITNITMIPHAVGSVRGAFATIHGWLREENVTNNDIARVFSTVYKDSKFIRIVRGGLKSYPDIKDVIGSNFVDIGWVINIAEKRITVFVATDNLVRGAAGQAIQSMNISLGLDEDEGLFHPPIHPM